MGIHSIITGSGSCLPERKVLNEEFLYRSFFEPDGKKIEKHNEEIIRRFHAITGINERRYVTDEIVTSDIAFNAARKALVSAKIDGETLDYIIVAHNFGNIKAGSNRSELVPSIASQVKRLLQIKNPDTIPYDLIFGCPGWMQAVIQADCFIRSGEAKRIMVIGAETLSRIADPFDRDSMIYADGAGAVILEASRGEDKVGILSYSTKSYTDEGLNYVLKMGKSYEQGNMDEHIYLKMQGRTLYEFALKMVPKVIKESIEKAGLSINDIYKLLIHQANNKMNQAILGRLYNEYGLKDVDDSIMPMTISWLGNSSVATIPILYDLFSKGQINHHIMKKGKILVFASMGAGVNINSLVYGVPA